MKELKKVMISDLCVGDRIVKPIMSNNMCIINEDTVLSEKMISGLSKYNVEEILIERKIKLAKQEVEKMKRDLFLQLKEQFKYYEGDVKRDLLIKVFLRHLLIKIMS